MTFSVPDTKPLTSSVFPSGYFSFPAIQGQNPWLDVLRAIAVILVLLRHGERALTHSYSAAASPLHTLFINGWVGVDLFLVLSGYLIGKSLIKMFNKDNHINIKSYFRGRALRIIPAYYAVLFITALGVFPLFSVSNENLPLRVFYHMLFLQDYLRSNINVVFWSLGVEEKFYIFAPLLAFMLVKIKQLRVVFFFLALLFLCSPLVKSLQYLSASSEIDYQAFFQNYRSPFHLSMEPLIVGLGISYFEIKRVFKMTPSLAKLGISITALMIGCLLLSHEFLANFGLWDMAGQPISLAILFGLMVIFAGQMSNVAVIGEALWRFISRLSYALYLIHFPLIPLALALTSPNAPLSFWGIYIALTLAGALILHFMVEKPFLILKSRQSPKVIPSR